MTRFILNTIAWSALLWIFAVSVTSIIYMYQYS